jgi:PAS domain S-box-containing protein
MAERAGMKNGRRVPRTALPYAVLAAALVLTGVGTAYVAMSVGARERLRFEAATRRVEERIGARMATYTALLRATDGLFASVHPVMPEVFKAYASRLDLRENYPGVFGIGYAVRFEPENTRHVEAFMRDEVGFERFSVWPESGEDDRTSIVYLEPQDERNAKAVGYDMYAEPVRREAMRRARDEGMPAASGRVVLVQDEGDPAPTTGFLIYMPMYHGGSVPATLEERRARIRGYVYCPFRSSDLFGDVFAEEAGSGLEVRIFDGTEQDAGHLLYRTDDAGPARTGLKSALGMEVAGRPWTVVMAAGPGFYWWPARYMPVAAGLLGLALSGSLFAVVRGQVSGRLRAERITSELRESRRALRRSEGKFRRLSDSNLVGVVFSRTDGRIVDGNDAFLRMLGYSREEVVGGAGLTWRAVSAPECRAADERAVAQLGSDGVCEPYETEYVRRDGTRVPVMAGMAVLEDSPGETVGFAVDLTEVKRAQREMQEAKESAEAANRLKDEFLATVSHELRTPLNAILGWAQVLDAEGAGESEDVRGAVATILRNARAQAQLIEDLLDVSRIVSGKLRLEARPVDLAAVVRAAVRSVQLAAEAKGVGLVDEAGATGATVWGDPDRLQQVLWNLLSNAIKFTERGGTIRVGLRREAGYARLTVTDTGAGIDRAFLPYVFERFRQADASLTRRHGGLGLGLSIVRNLVEMHGGTVRVESDGTGRGATFTVSLPTRPAPAGGGAPRAADANGSRRDRPALAGVRVLVVDDDPDTRELVRHVLAGQQADVVTAATAARAMDVLRTGGVGVLVSDLAMPDGDGYELIRMVREMPVQYGGRVPAVALSALTRAEERDRALAAGFQAHLGKPVDAGELVGVVAELGKR